MEKDASSAGVERGGLMGTAEIKILICYILSTVNEPVPVNMLANVLHYEGIANGFEVSDAVMSLLDSGKITPFDEKEDTYIITESGRNIASTLQTSLSYTVKNKAFSAALKMMSRYKRAKSTDFKVTKEETGTYLTCTALDGKLPFFSVKLLVADEAQANCIKEKFLSSSDDIYSEFIEILTKQ